MWRRVFSSWNYKMVPKCRCDLRKRLGDDNYRIEDARCWADILGRNSAVAMLPITTITRGQSSLYLSPPSPSLHLSLCLDLPLFPSLLFGRLAGFLRRSIRTQIHAEHCSSKFVNVYAVVIATAVLRIDKSLWKYLKLYCCRIYITVLQYQLCWCCGAGINANCLGTQQFSSKHFFACVWAAVFARLEWKLALEQYLSKFVDTTNVTARVHTQTHVWMVSAYMCRRVLIIQCYRNLPQKPIKWTKTTLAAPLPSGTELALAHKWINWRAQRRRRLPDNLFRYKCCE